MNCQSSRSPVGNSGGADCNFRGACENWGRGSGGVKSTVVSQSVRETSRDESQNVLSTQKTLQNKRFGAPNFLGISPKLFAALRGIHPYLCTPVLPRGLWEGTPGSGVRKRVVLADAPCTEISSKKSFTAVLPWQKKAMILDIPGPQNQNEGTFDSPKRPFYKTALFDTSRYVFFLPPLFCQRIPAFWTQNLG